jgi:nitrite reductase/ring-hydroxylating ferredoxin subunit/(2Fe-2S) ferredoxin
MGQYDRHVFVCTGGETCPTQGDVEKFVKVLRDGARAAGKQQDVRINKAGCFSQCGHGPMLVVYPEDVWYHGVQESDLKEILDSHIIGGKPVERLRYNPGKPGANKIEVEPTAAQPKPSAGPVWHRVCAVTDVPVNGIKEVAANGMRMVVVNTGSGFVAYEAMCPHEAIPLAEGICDGAVLTCLEHMWQFDVKTGAPMGDAQEGLKGFPLKEEKGDIYVAVDH